jgi:hypothetical protein
MSTPMIADSTKRRARKWKAPNNPTPPSRQIWGALFPGHPWPKGWRVQWVGFMNGALGLCDYSTRRILLSYGDAVQSTKAGKEGPVEALLHEIVHMRGARKHGTEFLARVNALRERLGFERLTRGSWQAPVRTPEEEIRHLARQVKLRAARAQYTVGDLVSWPTRKARTGSVRGRITEIQGARLAVISVETGDEWWGSPLYPGLVHERRPPAPPLGGPV